MKHTRMDILSFLCCLAGLAASLFFLILGVRSINAEGWGQLGIIFIPPSAAAIIFISADFLALLRKKWAAWSWSSTICKCLCAGLLIRPLSRNLATEIRGGVSNFYFYLMILIFLLVTVIPSVWNIIRLRKQKREKNRGGAT